MKLYIDSADINTIKRLYDYYSVDGVTTNPSILYKAGGKPYDVLRAIRNIIGDEGDLFVQTVSLSADGIIKEAEHIREKLGGNTYIKIPSFPEGIKAMKTLKREGFKVCATAVYNAPQAFMALKCGVDYIAPYVNRIDNLGHDGVGEVKRMEDIIENNGFGAKLVAASFKNTFQVIDLIAYGIGAVTIAPSVFDNFLSDSNVESAISAFSSDFEKLTGSGKTMIDD